MEFTFYSPTRIIFSSGSLDKLGVEACKFGDKALLVTGRTFARKYGYTDKMLKLMKDNGVKAAVFDKVEPNPSFETVEAGAMLALKEKIDFVVAFGGGSAIDAAKAIAVLFSKGGRIRDYIGVSIDEDVIPIIAIPTTCGTGSEVTRYSVLTDVENRKKVVVVGEALLPRIAIIDPTILQHLPPKLIAYTGFDALSHAIESLVSKKSNPMSDLVALESSRIIFENLEKAVKKNEQALERLHYASMLAGIAINCAGTTIAHGLGYYLTVYHGLQHGLANALLLPYVVSFNFAVVPEKFIKLAQLLGISTGEGEKDSRRIVEAIMELRRRVGIPGSLAEAGIPEKELDKMVAEAVQYERNLRNNIREVTLEDIKKIYLKAFKGEK